MANASPRRAQTAHNSHRCNKQTHKLPSQLCVLWLPQRSAYLRHIDLSTAAFETVAHPHAAWQLEDEEAEAQGLAFRELTGLRVALRPFVAPTNA